MNTVAAGDSFEAKAYDLLRKAIEEDKLGISPKHSKVFQKKGYYSALRKKEIIFDLSIEIWPPGADRYTLLYIIECKSYSDKKVPVDDVEEFITKLVGVANYGFNIKGAMISNGSFQTGSLEVAKNTGLMLVEVNPENNFSIKLYKTQRDEIEFDETSKQLETFIYEVFNLSIVRGLRRLSKNQIDSIASAILREINPNILSYGSKFSINDIVKYFEKKYFLKFDFEHNIYTQDGRNICGLFDLESQTIKIDRTFTETKRIIFLLAHEIGHFILHSNLEMNQQVYNNFQDSEYDFLKDKHLFNNYKNWIEWQANYFACSLIMPKYPFILRMIKIQQALGISKYGHINLDNQPINQQDFYVITKSLSDYFNTTKTSVIYRLEDLDLITYVKPKNEFQHELRNIYSGITELDI